MKLSEVDIPSHEAVYRVEDADVGVVGFIALHSTVLGPAVGGLRMWSYIDEQAALADVLRLSEGMTYKNAAAALPLGGGKAVLIGDPATQKTPEKLRAFASAIQSLGGRYWTAEDMGMTPDDMAIMAEVTDYVAGLPDGPYASGDPSPVTAKGVFNAIRTTLKHKAGDAGITGKTVAVQGLGHVGLKLCQLLSEAGANLIVTDIDGGRVARAKEKFNARPVSPEDIYLADADVFAPCAMGGILTQDVIQKLNVSVVAGGANNQLPTDANGDQLHDRSILYAPDFVVNGGGVINVSTEILKIENKAEWVNAHLRILDKTLSQILADARSKNINPNRVSKDFVANLIKMHAKDGTFK